MEKEIWENVEIFIKDVLRTVHHKIDAGASREIEHFTKYDEYEMAFEILFNEIIKLKEVPQIDFKKSKEIAQFLKLDVETIYDVEFWTKFEKLVATPSTSEIIIKGKNIDEKLK